MTLYDLVNQRGTHFSPNSWRVRMALAPKGLAFAVRDGLFGTSQDPTPGQKTPIPPSARARPCLQAP